MSAEQSLGFEHQEAAVMTIDHMVDTVWQGIQRGMYYPAELHGKLSLDEAYRVQLGLLACYERTGEQQAGWKVGLTAKAMQAQQGVYEPVFGFLLLSGQRSSGTTFDCASLVRPGFENELCITVGTTLTGPGVTLEQARSAISHVAPALEIVEKRGDLRADLALTLADNTQQKAFVTGAAVPLGALDLAQVTLDLTINGVAQERARGVEVLGTPVASIAWLANKLAVFGLRLEAGMCVMSGSFTKQYAVNRGDTVHAQFEPLGLVSAEFC
jgi:2-keto-4-pentenoate hydratase